MHELAEDLKRFFEMPIWKSFGDQLGSTADIWATKRTNESISLLLI